MLNLRHILFVIGNLANDPVVAKRGQYEVTQFTVASTPQKNDEKTMYIKVSAWGALGKTCMNCLSKGSLVFARGELRVSPFIGHGGEAKASIELTADDVVFLSRPSGSAEPEPKPEPKPADGDHSAFNVLSGDDPEFDELLDSLWAK